MRKNRKGDDFLMQEVLEIARSMIPSRIEAAVGGITGMCGALITMLFGGWSDALTSLLIAMAIDYLTGVLAAAVQPTTKIDYHIGATGLAKKAGILLIVAAGHVGDIVLGTSIVEYAVIYGYLANEGLSIIGNAEAAGIPVPGVVKAAYTAIGEKSKSIGGK